MQFSSSQYVIVPALSSILAATIGRTIVERFYPKYIKSNNIISDPPMYLTCPQEELLKAHPFYKKCKSEGRQFYEKLIYSFLLFLVITTIFIKSRAENYAVKAFRSIGFSQKRSKKQKKSRRRKRTRKQ